MGAAQKRLLSSYRHSAEIQTRWMDNDIYGHVNNVVYYSYFDTAVNRFLIEGGVLDIHEGKVIGLVVETGCQYFAPVEFPKKIQAGIGVSRIGNSSVRYEIGLFAEGQNEPVAQGFFIHVYVDKVTRRPTSLPDEFRRLLETIELAW
ncbi:acyl-CoA thioesterase [Kordiimonas pumila]|uniref:Acyl-CoA thioesterase n=1 Tax=Kordiimonas pumila TaxID=2161677 RepID=A0ABV7D1V0_9PROT|nr:thioesterase family protein [Kordiimonas pumila]